jgi:peptide-methionine (S)-S-oxide reductase
MQRRSFLSVALGGAGAILAGCIASGKETSVVTKHFRYLVTLAASLLAVACSGAVVGASAFPDPVQDIRTPGIGTQTAVLAGGCFWGVEGVFERLNGVSDVVSGYAGGNESTASYRIVSTGATGHAESVKITYDPNRISYGQLLKIFFTIAHDSTELNRQGPDEGTEYRSSIFYVTEEQKQVATAYIKQLDDAKVFRRPIVTAVVPLEAFYPAEAYHQNFLVRNPTYPYIVYNDLPKLKRLEREFPAMVKGK